MLSLPSLSLYMYLSPFSKRHMSVLPSLCVCQRELKVTGAWHQLFYPSVLSPLLYSTVLYCVVLYCVVLCMLALLTESTILYWCGKILMPYFHNSFSCFVLSLPSVCLSLCPLSVALTLDLDFWFDCWFDLIWYDFFTFFIVFVFWNLFLHNNRYSLLFLIHYIF